MTTAGSLHRFPDGFIWGTATSAHQVEGNNWNNDWWAWEHTAGSGTTEPSGDACDHYHRYAEDIATLAELGFGAYRFSVEWSRIEPEDGEFSRAALEHYTRMCRTVRDHGMLPIVTFHHFTTPRWAADAGGWIEPCTAQRFARFCAWTAAQLGDLMGRACTINEPNIVATIGYLTGLFPPGKRNQELRDRANEVLIEAHRLAVEAIRREAGPVPVGLTIASSEWTAVGEANDMVEALRRPMEDVFLDATAGDDFIGVQTYSRARVGPNGYLGPEEGAATTLMGYEFRPQALEVTIRRAWERARIPVLVTENGIAATNDARRIEFVRLALEGVQRTLADGIPVEGYCYWSALDNFEWALGYGPTFGLIAVDRTTQERTVKPSARWLGGVARANSL